MRRQPHNNNRFFYSQWTRLTIAGSRKRSRLWVTVYRIDYSLMVNGYPTWTPIRSRYVPARVADAERRVLERRMWELHLPNAQHRVKVERERFIWQCPRPDNNPHQ